MSAGGVIFLALSWGIILFLTALCFIKVFSKKDTPKDIARVECDLDDMAAPTAAGLICALLEQRKFSLHTGSNSKNEVGRLIRQGAVKIDGEKISDPNLSIMEKTGKELLLQVAKRSFIKVLIKGKK